MKYNITETEYKELYITKDLKQGLQWGNNHNEVCRFHGIIESEISTLNIESCAFLSTEQWSIFCVYCVSCKNIIRKRSHTFCSHEVTVDHSKIDMTKMIRTIKL